MRTKHQQPPETRLVKMKMSHHGGNARGPSPQQDPVQQKAGSDAARGSKQSAHLFSNIPGLLMPVVFRSGPIRLCADPAADPHSYYCPSSALPRFGAGDNCILYEPS